jgi:hypothetical protein
MTKNTKIEKMTSIKGTMLISAGLKFSSGMRIG